MINHLHTPDYLRAFLFIVGLSPPEVITPRHATAVIDRDRKPPCPRATNEGMDEEQRVCDVDEVPDEGTFLFTMREGFEEVEAFLVRTNDGIEAYTNYCQHWTDVRLDKGSGAATRDGEILCQKHGALFATATGECTFGPCEGAFLNDVTVGVHDGGVYLMEDDYTFDHVGRATDVNLSSGSRIDFTGT